MILRFLKSNLIILLIIFVAAALRLSSIEEKTTFSGDQGYDFLIVKRMIKDGDFTLLGPKIGPYNEIGNLYLGPAYYYLIAFPLLLSNFDPLGPAIFTTVLSLGTIYITYLIGVRYFSRWTGHLAAILYATSPLLINQERAPSNPHLAPFFSALIIFSLLNIATNKPKKLIWQISAGLCLGIIFQLHYIAVSMFVVIFAYLTWKKDFNSAVKIALAAIVAVLPQIIFELRNNFFVSNIFIRQMTEERNFSRHLFINKLEEGIQTSSQLLSSTTLTLNILVIFLIVFTALKSNGKTREFNSLLLLFIAAALLITALYSGPVGFHYFSPIYVPLVIVFSLTFLYCLKKSHNIFLKCTLLILLAQVFTFNLLNLDLGDKTGYTMPNGWNLKGAKVASKIISADIEENKTFNVASTLDGDTRARPIRYLLEVQNKFPLDVEKYPESDILYLVSKDDENTLSSYTVWEVASFAPFNVHKLAQIQNGITVYKLTKSIEND